MPQLALQHTWPVGQVALPQVTGGGGGGGQVRNSQPHWLVAGSRLQTPVLHPVVPSAHAQAGDIGAGPQSVAAHGAGVGLQASWMQAPPGGVQMPQLALQHTWPAGQVAEPQVAGGGGGGGGGGQTRNSQPHLFVAGSRLQTPVLQPVEPSAQAQAGDIGAGPQSVAAHAAGVGLHASWIQAPPGGVQMPQLALQHTWPAGQVALPHVTGGGGGSGGQVRISQPHLLVVGLRLQTPVLPPTEPSQQV